MPVLWTPENRPPQISKNARRAVVERIAAEGVLPVSNAALVALQREEEALACYLDYFGAELNDRSAEGFWPERMLKFGAALSLMAYREAGYSRPITDDVLDLSKELAELEGVPDAYVTRLFDDRQLGALVHQAGLAEDLDVPNVMRYRQVLGVGAGCVRFHLQNVLEANTLN